VNYEDATAAVVSVALIQESAPRRYMARVAFARNGTESRAIPWAGIMLTMLMLVSIMMPVTSKEGNDGNDILNGDAVDSSRKWTQSTPVSVDNYESGGEHLVTGNWWEPKNPWIATSDDFDADGHSNTNDSHPWDRHLPGHFTTDCTYGCVSSGTFSISENGEMPKFTESFQSYSEIIDATLGDLDKDGDLDLVFIGGMYAEYSENVNGEFQTPKKWTSLTQWIGDLNAVELADINNDGFLDALVSGHDGIIAIDLEDVFDPAVYPGAWWIVNSHESDANNWAHVEIGDVNGDHCPDILASTWEFDYDLDYRLRLKVNDCQNDSFSFTEGLNHSTSQLYGAILMDVNGDGYDDIVQASNPYDTPYWNQIWINLSLGDGTFGSGMYHSQSNATIGSFAELAAGDLNNDGYEDLIVLSDYSGAILFSADISGSRGLPTTFDDENFATIICSDSARLGSCGADWMTSTPLVDINHDGLTDIMLGGHILLNRGSDTGAKNYFQNYWNSGSSWLRAGDITGNGVQDILAITIQSPMAVFYNGGSIPGDNVDTTFISPGNEDSQQMNSIGLANDFDNDGDLDIITSSLGNKIGIHINDGIGGFSEEADIILETQVFLRDIITTDFNGDGINEIVVSARNSISVYWGDENLGYNESSNGDMTYLYSIQGDEMAYFGKLLIQDFNGDGFPDIAFDTESHSNSSNRTLNIILYDDNIGSFSLAWNSSTSANSWTSEGLHYLDLDLDGNTELIRCLSDKVEIFNASGDLFNTEPWTINERGKNCIFMDANFDNVLDLVSLDGSKIQLIAGPNFEYTFIDKYVYAAISFAFVDIDLDGYPELIVGTSKNQKMKIYNLNYTDITSLIWEGGNYRNNHGFVIADFNGDGTLDILQRNFNEPWELIFSIQDTDYDTSPDDIDAYPLNPTQYLDSDDDGFGDNQKGFLPDDCPFYWGDSEEDRKGCPDQDGDGWSDLEDDFWRDPTQWKDTDGDGFGDNHDGSEERFEHWPGIYVLNASNSDPSPLDFDNDGWEDEGLSIAGWDDCPKQAGWSYEDRIGCVDTDYDGWSNNDDYWDQGDVFPNDITQWADTDGDGFGDNLNGTNGDEFPNDGCAAYDMDRDGLPDFIKPNCETSLVKDEDTDGDGFNNTMEMQLGTNPNNPESKPLDYDGDGIADIIDAFPEDPTEFRDRDKDGIGDNSDFCINKETNESLDCSEDGDNDGVNDLVDQFPSDENEWIDSDGDGVGDNSDVWEDDPDIWSDADGDGWADQFGHILTDDCPSLKGTSNIFMNGCSDLDEDGMPDILDPDIDGDDITNDNEMDASSGDLNFDPFDSESKPPDIDGDFIPDVLDHDRDGDGFPDEFEKERGSDYKDPENTPFNQYGNQDTGLFYVPGEGFKSQYDPEGVEISVSWLIDLITSELLVPLAMIPLTVFALMRKRRRYKKMRNRLEDCKDLDMLKEYEDDIDDMVINRKVKVEHGMLLRNMFERMKEEFEDQEQVRLLGGKSSAGSGGMGSGGNMQQSGPMIPERLRRQGMGGTGGSPGPRRPGGRY